MTILFFIFLLVCVGLLVASAALQPNRSRYSEFELRRRKSAGETQAAIDDRRDKTLTDIISLQRLLQAVLLVLIVACAMAAFGVFGGILVALAVSLSYGKVASFSVIRRHVQVAYDKYESEVIGFVERYAGWLRFVRTLTPQMGSTQVASRDELRDIVSRSHGVISREEAEIISASLEFDAKVVSDIMTPKSVVDTVKAGDILGPLTLDDLHKTGHSRFPVIDQDIDHVVGILYLRDVLTLDTSRKHTAKVESAMSKQVYYIRHDHSLKQALAAFLKTHHHMFIVINEYRETVGIVTLEDTLEALLGKKIIDEFDAHDDMRAVAERNAASRNAPNHTPASTDV